MVYILHFNQAYKHARHYIGYTEQPVRRIAHHRAGTGARLTQVLKEHGIGFVVARVWVGDKTLERKLHKRGGSRLCPVCNPTYKSARLKRDRSNSRYVKL